MPAFLVSIRISGENLRGSDITRHHYSYLEGFMEALKTRPGIEVDLFMSQELEQPSSSEAPAADSLAAKPRINDNPTTLAPAIGGRLDSLLRRLGFTTLNQLSWLSRKELGRIGGIAKKSLDGIEAALQTRDLALLPSEVSLKQRDWQYLPVRGLMETSLLPTSRRPRGLPFDLELGQYLALSEGQLNDMIGRSLRTEVGSGVLKEHQDLIARIKPLVA